mgnify:CR=1 FL=1
MLHARGENIDQQYSGKSALALVDQDIPKVPTVPTDEPVLESRFADSDADTGKDSGNESVETDSDSDEKTESIKAIQNALVGMNVSVIDALVSSFEFFHGHFGARITG